YGANFRHAAAPTRPVVGVVRDKDTKEPLAGVAIHSVARNPGEGMNAVQTTTDAQGRYRLTGMAKGQENRVVAMPAGDLPYVVVSGAVPDPDGLDPVTVDFALKRGVWVEGKVTDKATGKPLRAHLQYFARDSNPNLRDYPGFDFAAPPRDLVEATEDGS